jgi:hypothetical protein
VPAHLAHTEGPLREGLDSGLLHLQKKIIGVGLFIQPLLDQLDSTPDSETLALIVGRG